MSKDLIKIRFLKWEKWQGRSDVKRPWWFKFSNKFFTGSDLQILTKDEKYLFAIMLCEASNQNKNGELVLPIKFLESWGECSENVVFSTLKKLNEIEILTEIWTESGRNLDGICAKSVLQTKTKTKTKKINTKKALEEKKQIGLSDESPTQSFIKIYDKVLKKRYGDLAKLVITPKIIGQINRLVKDIGLQRASDLIQAYFQMDDDWFIKKRHDFGTFTTNLQSIALAFDTGNKDPGAPKKESLKEYLAKQKAMELKNDY